MPRRSQPRRIGRQGAARRIQAMFRRRRYRRRMRPAASVKTGYISTRQKSVSNQVIPAGAYPNGFLREYTFTADQIPQFVAFSSLFDQYRIKAVSMTFLPTTNTDQTVNQGATFASSIDLDGDLSITTFNQLLQCSNTKTSAWSTAGGLTPYKKIYLRPRASNALITSLDAAGQPNTFTPALANPKQWLDIADRGRTVHYGVNIGWNFGTNNLNQAVDVQIITTYYIQFRKVR